MPVEPEDKKLTLKDLRHEILKMGAHLFEEQIAMERRLMKRLDAIAGELQATHGKVEILYVEKLTREREAEGSAYLGELASQTVVARESAGNGHADDDGYEARTVSDTLRAPPGKEPQ